VVDLPLAVTGEGVLSYRLARVLPQSGHVEVLLGGRTVDRFTCRGGRLVERQVGVQGLETTPLLLEFRVDARDERQLGVKLHSVSLEGRGRMALRGARGVLAGPLLVLVLGTVMLCAGFSTLEALLVATPWALGLSAVLLGDPLLGLRLTTGLAPVLVLFALLPLLVLRRQAAAGRVSWRDLRLATLCGVTAFLFRGALLNHPDFYYPDFMLHARLVQMVRGAGFLFLVHPARYLWAPRGGAGEGLVRAASGLWMRSLNGVPLGLPYSLAFHAPLALLPVGYDQLLTLIRLAGALLAALAGVGTFVFARRSGLSSWGAALMVFVPSYLSKLAVGAIPAFFGHAVDVAFLAWLAGQKPRRLVPGILFVAACDLAYVSAVIHVGVFLGVWAVLRALEGRDARLSLLPLGMAAGGGLLALAVYYRDFVPAVVALLRGGAGVGSGGYQEGSFLPLLLTRTVSFFGWGYPILGLVGLVLLARTARAGLLLPWGLTYVVLLLLRAEVPLVFRWVHDTLFVTPFLCLAAGEALAALWERGQRILALGLFLAFVLQGLVLGWLAVSAEFGHVI
jgi:hypothetical protein